MVYGIENYHVSHFIIAKSLIFTLITATISSYPHGGDAYPLYNPCCRYCEYVAVFPSLFFGRCFLIPRLHELTQKFFKFWFRNFILRSSARLHELVSH